MPLARRTITVAGRAVVVEQGRVAKRENLADGLNLARSLSSAKLHDLPPNAAFLAARLRDLAHHLRRLAPPSRTRPHLFTEVKDELASEIERIAGEVRF